MSIYAGTNSIHLATNGIITRPTFKILLYSPLSSIKSSMATLTPNKSCAITDGKAQVHIALFCRSPLED